jgi:RNA polymerase sigma-70 factor (ECF subfamily)
MNEKDAIYENLFRKAAFQDDEEAFRQLFLEFYPALCVFAMRSVYHEEEARDIVQDVFFKIWKNRKSINRVCLLIPNQAHNFICGPSG